MQVMLIAESIKVLLFFSFLSGADFVNPMMCMECFHANAEDMLCLGFLLQYEGENFTL